MQHGASTPPARIPHVASGVHWLYASGLRIEEGLRANGVEHVTITSRVVFILGNTLRPGLYKLHLGADHSHIRLNNIVALDVITLEVLEYTQEGVAPSSSNSGFVNGQATWQVHALCEARGG